MENVIARILLGRYLLLFSSLQPHKFMMLLRLFNPRPHNSKINLGKKTLMGSLGWTPNPNNLIKKMILHLLQLHVVSKVTGPEHNLLPRIPQMLLQEVSSLHCPLQQCLIPKNSPYTSIGWEHQTWEQQREKWCLSKLGQNTIHTFGTAFFSPHFLYSHFIFLLLCTLLKSGKCKAWKKGSLWV